jgi:hypothetical protein
MPWCMLSFNRLRGIRRKEKGPPRSSHIRSVGLSMHTLNTGEFFFFFLEAGFVILHLPGCFVGCICGFIL